MALRVKLRKRKTTTQSQLLRCKQDTLQETSLSLGWCWSMSVMEMVRGNPTSSFKLEDQCPSLLLSLYGFSADFN
jgi:hypothetical protein